MPGSITILVVLLHLTAATVAAWAIWPWWLATGVAALCLVVVGTEQLRWTTLAAQ